ncbi:MAG: phosphatase PAP2 family protein [Rickettsiaceae bacterium]|nr:phosphatase PAP2 family protein [Rickettsiaceae bacterium]
MIKKYCIVGFAILAGILTIFPKVDISFSSLFYLYPLDFVYKNHPVAVYIFRLVPIITGAFAAFCLVYIIYLALMRKKIATSPALFLVITAILGPGLTVNYALKEHIGRARPRDILEFHGDKAFTGALRPCNECRHNCSFPSGHAAMGYYFTAISYVVPEPYKTPAFLFGVGLGSIIGMGRIIQGGHFLSDVVFSGLIIMAVNHLCFLIWRNFRGKSKKKRK